MPTAGDALPPEVKSVLLLSPGAGFWEIFAASEEHRSGAPDPLDRWSARVIGALAAELGGAAYFPFGPDAAPFLTWAARGGRAWSSPVHLLVGADMGLNTSYRGAIGLGHRIDWPDADRPCEGCAAPCETACPVGALTPAGYDVPACQAYLRATPECDCRQAGCLVRRACPVSVPQTAAQAQFHMAAFLG
ncbi:MAG: ferredoxin [Pseudomonadota bacterium]